MRRGSTDEFPKDGSTHGLQPATAHFDRVQRAWVLSRYADVLAALREPRLCQVGPPANAGRRTCDERAQAQKRAEVRATLTSSRLTEWHGQILFLTHRMIGQLPKHHVIDLVQDFIRPWSLAVSLTVNGFNPAEKRRLTGLASYLLGGEKECHNSVLRSRAATALAELRSSLPTRVGPTQVCKSAFRFLFQILHYSIAAASLELPKRLANAEFEKLDRTGAIPMGKSVFLGTSQTISFFLANAWLALLRNPAQLVRLRAEPDLMPRAIEELLRYAGVVHTLFRRATADVDLAGVRISKNERVVLRVGAANRDPAQFPEPDRLNITRRATGQLGLGAGPHSCVGALLVRMAAGIATTAFVSELAVTEMNSSIEWYRNCNVSTPASIRVLLQESRPHVNAQE